MDSEPNATMEPAQNKALAAAIDEILVGRVEQAIQNSLDRLLGPAIRLEELRRKEFLTESEVGELFSVPPSSIRSERSRGFGPSYVKDGRRVLYSRQEVAKYFEARKVKTKR